MSGEPARAFNANSIESSAIKAKLQTRYKNAINEKTLPIIERNGIASKLEVNIKSALLVCEKQLQIIPHCRDFSFSVVDCRTDDITNEIPDDGFQLFDNSGEIVTPSPSNFIVPLMPEQSRSVNWMIQREREAVPVSGLFQCISKVGVPPFHNFKMKFQLHVSNMLRGGCLCDEVGFFLVCFCTTVHVFYAFDNIRLKF